MAAVLQSVLLLLALLQLKHLFADFFLQTPRMLSDRDKVLHLGRFYHVAMHGAFSFVILLGFGTTLAWAILLSLVELIIHYIIDFTKGWHGEATGYQPHDAGYWRAFGIDQLAHHWTYIAMVWVWASTLG